MISQSHQKKRAKIQQRLHLCDDFANTSRNRSGQQARRQEPLTVVVLIITGLDEFMTHTSEGERTQNHARAHPSAYSFRGSFCIFRSNEKANTIIYPSFATRFVSNQSSKKLQISIHAVENAPLHLRPYSHHHEDRDSTSTLLLVVELPRLDALPRGFCH